MKLTKKTVEKNLAAMAVNFEFEAVKPYMKLIFDQLTSENFTEDDFNKACNGIIKSETNFYGKKPPVAMFLKYADKKTLSLDQQAQTEAEKIIQASDYITATLFDNQTTNAAADAYGGLGKINYDLFDQYNAKRKDRGWLKKELIEIWLDCRTSGKRSNIPLGLSNAVRKDDITFIGDQATCQAMLDNSRKAIEAPSNPKVDEVVKSVGNRGEGRKFDFNKAKEEAFKKIENSPYYEY